MSNRGVTADGSARPFSRWLGLGRNRASGRTGAGGASVQDIAKRARRDLLDSISSFLLDNDLEISASNLITAHAAFSGKNRPLGRQIGQRLESGETITQSWLDGAVSSDRPPEQADLDKLMARLQASVETFSKTTKTARNATTDYNSALERHVVDLEQAQEAGQIISGLASLARSMLANTRQVEGAMRRSEEESKTLRHNLAKARRDAEIDHLTGLPNRRMFDDLLGKMYREARASAEPLCVAICDIDNFKRVNDTHGHAAGDRVLKMIGRSFARVSNDRCHVARYGGEEFVMLFRDATLAEAFGRLDALREQLANRQLVNRKNDVPFGQVTFSGGIANVFAYGDPGAALKAADDALYRAKQSGRNRLLMA